MNIKDEKVLVTGAGGFIGSHLTELLLDEGVQVRALLRYVSAGSVGNLAYLSPDKFARLEVYRGDLRDPDSLMHAVKGCSIVFHLGALISIPYSYINPSEYAQVNVLGTLNLMSACRHQGVRRFIHTSTSEVYGTALRVPIDEEHPLQGQSPYSASKIGADQLVTSFVRSFAFPAVTVRPFNTYGSRQSVRAIIPTIISQCLRGGELHLGALHPTRDLTFVGDTVRGFMLAAVAPGVIGEIINLGNQKEITIGDLARKIMHLMGREVPICSEESRLRPKDSEVNRLLSNAGKAKRMLDWEPTVPLDEGLTRVIEFITKDRPNAGLPGHV